MTDTKYGRYFNLKVELQRQGVTQQQVADHLGMTLVNFNAKINGKIPFTIPEIKEIHDRYAPDATYDYLLAVLD